MSSQPATPQTDEPARARVREALRAAARRLVEAGILNGGWDAELLLRHVTGWERARLLRAAHDDEALPDATRLRFEALVGERARRRPLQHLTGSQAFWRHEFRVTRDVLIPRPDTEILVEAALDVLRPLEAPLVVDVGTGSGCIALSLAHERPDARVHAVELSPAALDVARDNARRLGLAERVTFHAGDLLAPVAHLAGTIDAVVSNPPYVNPAERDGLAPEVVEHEPRAALFGEGGPYGTYERLIPLAAAALAPAGFLLLEIGHGMAPRVIELCRAAGFEVLAVRRDLPGIERVVVARRAPRNGALTACAAGARGPRS
jgi:release factor glutamine methyltransferase